MKFALKVSLVAAAIACVAGSALAQETLSLRGTFTTDNQVEQIPFVIGQTSDIIIRSFSYAGGVNAAGETIASGGFDPTISLFTAAGDFLAVNFDDDNGIVGVDPVSGQAYDVYLAQRLVAGDYIAVITQFDKTPSNQRGPTFTAAFGCSQGFFCDFLGDGVPGTNRTGNWAIDIAGIKDAPTPSPIPLPASVMLLGSAIAAGGGLQAFKRRASKSSTP